MYIPNNRRRQLGLTENKGSFKRLSNVEHGAEISTSIVLANFSRREQKLSGFSKSFSAESTLNEEENANVCFCNEKKCVHTWQ